MIAAQESMTAKLCSFARAYHSMLGKNKIFDDYLAYDIIGKDEYDKIGDLLKGQAEMTEQLGEPMGHGYSLDEMREILSAEGFVIRTHEAPDDIQRHFFAGRTDKQQAVENVHFLLAEKQGH